MAVILSERYPLKRRVTMTRQSIGHSLGRFCQGRLSDIRATLFGRGMTEQVFEIIIVLALATIVLVLVIVDVSGAVLDTAWLVRIN
jgi:hypothetical protein